MEMDLVVSSKGKLVSFRMKELKDVLTKLGLPKQGKKQDLVDRILHQLSDEGVAKIIDDTYRKMQISEAADLASMGQCGLDLCNVKCEVQAEDSLTSDGTICCPCGTSLRTDSIIQCVDPRCLVQQHYSCVIIPEKPIEDTPYLPPLFFCETCRIKRSDPFWLTVAHLVSPMKLVASTIPTDGANPQQSVEATFQLTKAHTDLLQNTEYDVQAWCILLNDKVPFRMQWPLHAELQVNGVLVRTVNRPGTQLLGANGRDDGALITVYVGEGVNQISLLGCDARSFCFGVRLVKRQTVEQVLSLIPKEKDGELFEDALGRVRRCIGGGMATGNEGSDSDLEVIADSITVNLRCPMSGSRIKIAGRFRPCVHMGCFDLETFVELNQRARKWQCPICLKNYSIEEVVIDRYFNNITTMMRNCGEDITEIEVKQDGSWRVKNKGEENDLTKWHFPGGSTAVARNEVVSNSQPRQLEDGSGNTIIDRIKKNLSANVDMRKYRSPSPRNDMNNHVENNSKKFNTLSSSASGSSRDVEYHSFNQDRNTGYQINQIPNRIDPVFGTESQNVLIGHTDVIVLSDSEEDIDVVPSSTSYQSLNQVDTAPTGISESYFQAPAFDTASGPCFGPFNETTDDIGMSNWSFPSGTPDGCDLQLFDAVSNVSDAFTDLENSLVACSVPMGGCNSASKPTLTTVREVLDSPVCHSNMDISEHLIENTLPFFGEDPSIGHVLPNQRTALFMESDPGKHPSTKDGFSSGNWISLRLGSEGAHGDIGSHSQTAASNGLELRRSCRSNGVSLRGEPKCARTNNRKISDGPFSFPRQPRSVRQKVDTKFSLC